MGFWPLLFHAVDDMRSGPSPFLQGVDLGGLPYFTHLKVRKHRSGHSSFAQEASRSRISLRKSVPVRPQNPYLKDFLEEPRLCICTVPHTHGQQTADAQHSTLALAKASACRPCNKLRWT